MAEYQWYPGHMTKARRMMQENIKLVDLVIELADARIPVSSRNPDIDQLAAGKARILLLNKADLADERATAAWREYYETQGVTVLATDARGTGVRKNVNAAVQRACAAKIARDRKRGIVGRPIRAMVCGIPNVGKSTFINSFAGKASAKTGNKPGVTRGKQWIRLGKNLEMLDTPGILWPKFDDQVVGIRLALVGAIREEILDEQELSIWLLDFLRQSYPDAIPSRYLKDFDEEASASSAELLGQIARSRKWLRAGAEPDYDRTCRTLLDDFKNGRIGRITLDPLPQAEEQ